MNMRDLYTRPTIATDLEHAAAILTERGVWTGEGAFGADAEQGPVDPTAALWMAVHDGKLPFLFTSQMPGAAAVATEMVLNDDRVRAAVEFLSANLTDDETAIVDEAPVERIADWVTKRPEVEVIGRLARLAEPAVRRVAA